MRDETASQLADAQAREAAASQQLALARAKSAAAATELDAFRAEAQSAGDELLLLQHTLQVRHYQISIITVPWPA